DGAYPCRFFCGTGMHGGKIILRCDDAPTGLPRQVLVRAMTDEDREELAPHVQAYCEHFGGNAQALLAQKYFVLTPNPEAGYKQLYTFE
ncbi:MAG: glutamate synthase, partial [Candidatus Ventricola sp.]